MRFLVQRVSEASVQVKGKEVARIGRGLLVLVGFHQADTPNLCESLIAKLLKLRIFPDEADKMNLSVRDVGGELLFVPQFTLYGDTSKGNRPSFIEAARSDQGSDLFDHLISLAKISKVPVQAGLFQAKMAVALVNDGPVTVFMEATPDGRTDSN